MTHGTYDDFWQARNLRPHLKDIKPAVHDRRRLVRRRGPVRRAARRYQRDRGEQPRHEQRPGHGPVDPRRLERAATARRSAPSPFGAKTAEFYREQIEFPFFEYHLKGKGDDQAARGVRSSRPAPTSWRTHDAWPPKAAKPRSLYLHAGGRLGSSPARRRRRRRPSTSTSATRPSRCRTSTRSTSACCRVHGRRPALRRPPARRAGVPDRAARRRPDARRPDRRSTLHVSTTGTDSDWVVKLIDVYPDDYPDPNPNPTGRPDGRLPAAGPRRRDARQVPQQLREARAVRARQADRGRSSRCPTSATPSAPGTG